MRTSLYPIEITRSIENTKLPLCELTLLMLMSYEAQDASQDSFGCN